MNPRILSIGIVAVGALVLVTGQVFSQEGGGKGQGPDMAAEMRAAMEQWMKISAPGEQHQGMASRAGKWDAVVKMWLGGPQAPPTESHGVSEVKVILGGRFVVENFKCDMQMAGQTMGYEGVGISGYDNYKKMYSTFWIDNMNTQMMTMLGTHVPGGNKIIYYGQMDEPMQGVQDRMIKSVVTLVSEDKHVFEMYDLHAGDDHKVMEITYTRVK